MHISEWLQAIPAIAIVVVVGVVIGVESLGVPLPGEIVLVSAALMSAQHIVDPLWVGVAASAGAIIGDSIGYSIGRRGGRPLFERLGRRFPRHFGPVHLATAERAFQRWGMWAVFFGRFIALLRIFAGPLAGALRMRYAKFLVANATGGIVWAGGTTAVVYYLGIMAERWLQRFSWLGLIVVVLCGMGATLLVRRRATRRTEAHGNAAGPAAPASAGD